MNSGLLGILKSTFLRVTMTAEKDQGLRVKI